MAEKENEMSVAIRLVDAPPNGVDQYIARSKALDLTGVAWHDVPRYPLPESAVRTLRYMQDIESHTIIYLRELLATRAIDDPDVATFLACWFYEETFHGRALQQFLEAGGYSVVERQRSREPLRKRLEARGIAAVARLWRDFVAVHMSWGAINELTTLVGYQRLILMAEHPVLEDLLGRIIKDESRHFGFYFHQAKMRLGTRAAARVTRELVRRFWAPVGSGVQPDDEVRFLASYLFSDGDGRAAAARIDGTIETLPGMEGLRPLQTWMERAGC